MNLLALVLALLLVRWLPFAPDHQVMRLKVASWLPNYVHFLYERAAKGAYWGAAWMGVLVWLSCGVMAWLAVKFLGFFGLLGGVLGAAALLWSCLPDFRELLSDAHADQNSLLATVHERLFSVFFWFIILGPAGAFLFHGLTLLCRMGRRRDIQVIAWVPLLESIHHALGWIPARITGLFFCMVGNFETGFACWRQTVLDFKTENEAFVVACGNATLAVQLEQRQRSPLILAQALVERTSFAWMILFTIFDMLFK